MGSRGPHGQTAPSKPRPHVGTAKRGYADGAGLDGGRSAGIRRRERNEWNRVICMLALQNDENGNRAEAANDGRLHQASSRGDVSDYLVEVVVVEKAELPRGIRRIGIRQRGQRHDRRDQEQDEAAQKDPFTH